MNILPNRVRKRKRAEAERKEREQSSVDPATLLVVRPVPFDAVPADFGQTDDDCDDEVEYTPEMPSIKLEYSLENSAHNAITIKKMHAMQTAGPLSSSRDKRWMMHNSDRIAIWIQRHYVRACDNSDRYLSEAALMYTGRVFCVRAMMPMMSLETSAPEEVLREREDELVKRLTVMNGSTPVKEWAELLQALEHAAVRLIDSLKGCEDTECGPEDISRDPKVALIEKASAWQFTIGAQLSLLGSREVRNADVSDKSRSALTALVSEYNTFQESRNFYQKFIVLVHAFLLPMCPRQMFAQRVKRAASIEVDVANAWELFVDKSVGRAVHGSISAENIRTLWDVKDHPYMDLFVLQSVSDLLFCWPYYVPDFVDRFFVSPFQFANRYEWFYRARRNGCVRSPLIAHLLDSWYVATAAGVLYKCKDMVECVIVWARELREGKTDDGTDLSDFVADLCAVGGGGCSGGPQLDVTAAVAPKCVAVAATLECVAEPVRTAAAAAEIDNSGLC